MVRAGEPLLQIRRSQADRGRRRSAVDRCCQGGGRSKGPVRALGWLQKSIEGVVERVEPFGFTKVSALGIEEQRVNVVIQLTTPLRDAGRRLGHGYQVEARIVLWQSDAVVRIPLTSLFRVVARCLGGFCRGAGKSSAA